MISLRSFLLHMTVAVTAAISSIVPGRAEPAHPVKPLLWKVEGAGKTSYLFGTMHLGDKAIVTLHPAAERAFVEAEVLHSEIAFDAKAQLAAMDAMLRGDGRTLDEVLGEELSKRLAAELKAVHPDLDAKPFQPMRTWAVAYSLPYLPQQMAGLKQLDQVLWERAEKEGKKTAGMQEIKDQVAGFNELDEKEQTEFLISALDYMERVRRSGKNPMKEAVAVYVGGDPEQVFAIAFDWMADLAGGRETPLMKMMTERLLKDRDVIMADYISAALKEEPAKVHFFAAGAGHYCGEDSVPGMLEKKGYKVTRIEE